MVLDKANVELLKLVAVCKDVSCEHKHTGVNLLGNINVGLIREGLLYVSRDGRYYRATQVGYDLLNTMGYGYQSDTFRESHSKLTGTYQDGYQLREQCLSQDGKWLQCANYRSHAK